MTDLTTSYMGLQLNNPIIVGSSALTDNPEKIKLLANHGAGAVVLKSLFEEQIMKEVDIQRVNNIYGSYNDVENYVSFYTRKHNLDEYLFLVNGAKENVDIPVIASINCVSNGEWIEFAKQIQNAGADAIELNMFILPDDPLLPGHEIEQVYFEVIEHIKKEINIPVSMKIGSFFSGMANTLVELSKTQLAGLVLFNHFYSPDIDLDKEKIISADLFTSPRDIANTLRWTGILSNKVSCDIAASTGVHSGYDVLKAIMVGASATQVASTLYKNGIKHISTMLDEMESWMKGKGYDSIADIKGKLSYEKANKPMMYERVQFMKYYSSYTNL